MASIISKSLSVPLATKVSAFCVVVIVSAMLPTAAQTVAVHHGKPYRILLVVDAWHDPNSILVQSGLDSFQPIAALLKSWTIPFDIFRLDQQHIDSSYLLDRSGNIRYSALLWLADSKSYENQNFESIQPAINAGTGLIVLNSRLIDPALARYAGVNFRSFYTSTQPFRMVKDHFINRGLSDATMPSQTRNFSVRVRMAATSAAVLVAQDGNPLVTVKEINDSSSAVWIGVPEPSQLCASQFWRDVFLRSLVWEMGYAVLPDVNYDRRAILELDDWGTADKGFLSYWRYQEPNEEMIRNRLIEPLKRHHAVASAMVNTGYIDRTSSCIVSPWIQDFNDTYGVHQDYASTLKGLQEALDAGVLTIESHGWTHMQPDLDSPPGPWWNADQAGEGSVDGWYVEFWDRRRSKDIPASAQLYHMGRSLTEIQEDFKVKPLELKPGGDAWTISQFNNTAVLAGRSGFGLFHGDTTTYYLEHDLALDLAGVVVDADTGFDMADEFHPETWPKHPDGPVIVGFHDRDISLDPGYIDQLFASLPPGYGTISANQYIGILHTNVAVTQGDNSLTVRFSLDNDYCEYFQNHSSDWKLLLSDALHRELTSGTPQVYVDGKESPANSLGLSNSVWQMHVPSGTGIHRLTILSTK